MGLIDEFEKRVERAVEGAFNKAFRSNMQPSEIGRRLMREMEGGKSVSIGAVYVPNRYTIELAPRDHERMTGLMPTLAIEFIDLLKRHAGERKWHPAGRMSVLFEEVVSLTEGRFEVRAEYASSQEGDQLEPDEAKLTNRLQLAADPNQFWEMTGETMRLGRGKDNEVIVADQNASRNHAEIQRRGQDYWIVDLGSTNGTLVNETLVKQRRLFPGDEIRIGTSVLIYAAEGE